MKKRSSRQDQTHFLKREKGKKSGGAKGKKADFAGVAGRNEQYFSTSR
jgi:hypothetical protein